jgi:hypothetical protein
VNLFGTNSGSQERGNDDACALRLKLDTDFDEELGKTRMGSLGEPLNATEIA